MRGESRLDLTKLLVDYPKCELLVADFFGVNGGFNEIPFRDLYDFFDHHKYRPHAEAIGRNMHFFWVHNITDPKMGSVKQKEHNSRREAEIEMFTFSFYWLEEILTPAQKYYRKLDTTTDGYRFPDPPPVSFENLPF